MLYSQHQTSDIRQYFRPIYQHTWSRLYAVDFSSICGRHLALSTVQ